MMKVSFSSGNADIRLKLKTSREEHCMKPRMNYYQAAPDTIKALVAVLLLKKPGTLAGGGAH